MHLHVGRRTLRLTHLPGHTADSIGVMAGAILGAMHGDTVIDRAEADQIDTVNRLDLGAEAARFAQTARTVQSADQRHFERLASQRAQLENTPGLRAAAN